MDNSEHIKKAIIKLSKCNSGKGNLSETTIVVRTNDYSVKEVKDSFEKEGVQTKGGAESHKDFEIDESSIYERLVLHKEKKTGKTEKVFKSEKRFKVNKLIGEGATARIFSVKDHNFGREIAVKTPKQPDQNSKEVNDFIKEANVTANLEHPNIIPVYDLDMDNKGKVYLCMRKVRGHSLKQYIDTVNAGETGLQVKTIEEIILIFLKVCDAVSFAHSKGQIHQDIKPENIMIGNYGEVFLIDWGAALSNDEEVSLTPVYMSPEQANAGVADKRSDVYCLGATMFHVLTLRLPTLAKSMNELWQKKTQGIISFPTEKEKAKIPPHLMAILLKALEADPQKRYQSVEEFSQDLKNYQAGLAVSAYKDTLWTAGIRWYKRNRKSVWTSLFILFIIAGFGTYIWNEKLREIAYWGNPICVERFDGNSWRDKWIEYEGAFNVKDGLLVTVPGKGDAFSLIYRERLYGSIAIEFEGRMMPGTLPCDLSALWAEDVVWNKDKSRISQLNTAYYFQAGAYNNSFSGISKDGKSTYSYSRLTLERGRRYKIRAEVDGLYLRMFVDGRLICQYKGLFPLNSGYVGLYGYYPGKAFDNVKIYCKGVPEKISATQRGDALFKNKIFEAAIAEYQEVLRSHEGRKIADEALYKQGLCLFALDKKDQAYKLWKTIKAGEYHTQATYQLWMKKALEDGAHDQVVKEIGNMYKNADAQQRQEIISQWGALTGMISQSRHFNSLDKYLDLRERLFADDLSQRRITAETLLRMGRYDKILKEYPDITYVCMQSLLILGRPAEVLEKYPEQRPWCAKSLITLGRAEEVLEKYPDIRRSCAEALVELGRLEEVLEKYPDQRDSSAEALITLGRAEEVPEKYPEQRYCCAMALIALGYPAEVLEKYPEQRYCCAMALLYLGHLEEILEKYPDQRVSVVMAKYCIGLNSLMAGKAEKAKKLFSCIADERGLVGTETLMLQYIITPFSLYLINPSAPLRKRFKNALASQNQDGRKIWFHARFILGDITEEQFLKQPEKLMLESRLILAKALKADAGDGKTEAVQFYSMYKTLPKFKKTLDPAVDAFVEWRISAITNK